MLFDVTLNQMRHLPCDKALVAALEALVLEALLPALWVLALQCPGN